MTHLLLIHGAWGAARDFEEVLKSLERRGISASAIDLPGHGDSKEAIAAVTMEAYVARVVQAANAIDGPIVLAGHCLAGSIISQVAERIPDKIERLVYVAAILPRNGESAMGLMQADAGGELLAHLQFSGDQSSASVGPEAVKQVFLHDVREPERLVKFLPHFVMEQATEPFQHVAELSHQAFGSVPKTYIQTSLDRVLSPALQDRMAQSWPMDQVVSLDSGHIPLMSVPESLAQVLGEAVSVSAS